MDSLGSPHNRGMRVITVNVNGIRAAARRGMVQWLVQAQPDVLTLQEVRADDVELGKSTPKRARSRSRRRTSTPARPTPTDRS